MLMEKNINLTVRTDELMNVIASSIKQVLKSELQKLPQNNQSDELMTIADAAKYFKVSQQSIYKWKKNGILPFIKKQRRVYFKKSELIQHLEDSNNSFMRKVK